MVINGPWYDPWQLKAPDGRDGMYRKLSVCSIVHGRTAWSPLKTYVIDLRYCFEARGLLIIRFGLIVYRTAGFLRRGSQRKPNIVVRG
jgi:hypothetical protein